MADLGSWFDEKYRVDGGGPGDEDGDYDSDSDKQYRDHHDR